MTGLGYHTWFCPVLPGKPRASCLPGKLPAHWLTPLALPLLTQEEEQIHSYTCFVSFYPFVQFHFFFLPFPVPSSALFGYDCASCRAWPSWPWGVRPVTSLYHQCLERVLAGSRHLVSANWRNGCGHTFLYVCVFALPCSMLFSIYCSYYNKNKCLLYFYYIPSSAWHPVPRCLRVTQY